MHQSVRLWRYIGHVSFEHRLFQVLINYALREKGYKTKIEHDLGEGRRLDLYATKDGHSVGIEIMLTANNDYTNLLPISNSIDRLIIVCRDRQTVFDTEAWLGRVAKEEVRRKFSVVMFNQFMRDVKRNIIPEFLE
jgi:hypothetical protein